MYDFRAAELARRQNLDWIMAANMRAAREARIIETPWQKAIPIAVRRAVIERDGLVCRYCGRDDGDFHLDHVLPASRGGQNSADNLVVACAACNISKGARTPEGWLRRGAEAWEACNPKRCSVREHMLAGRRSSGATWESFA
ncbi:MAG: HNH endonuclease, partial [Sandaracinobacter sp.]